MVFLGTGRWYNGGMRASVRITELQARQAPVPAVRAFINAVVACEEHRGALVEHERAGTVSVNDPNPAKVHAVLNALADMGIIVG